MAGRAGAIYLVGGTTEANLAAARLAGEGYSVTLSVTTPMGALSALAAGRGEADVGPKDAGAMAERAAELGALAIVDCSHPFAVSASEEARRAASLSGLPYLRFSRAPVSLGKGGPHTIRAGSFPGAVEILLDRGHRALLTVGVRRLELFAKAKLDFAARILPLPGSLAECVRLGIEPRDIIAAHPPFGADFNRACIRQARAGILVTKDSGEEGGLREKAAAAREENIPLLIIERPPEPGVIHDLETLVERLSGELSG